MITKYKIFESKEEYSFEEDRDLRTIVAPYISEEDNEVNSYDLNKKLKKNFCR